MGKGSGGSDDMVIEGVGACSGDKKELGFWMRQ